MQRQLKFRAWAEVEKGHKRIIEWETSRRLIAEWIGNEERGVEIMAWTGLKDKNGKEIYEGDITEWGDSKEKCRIDFDGGCFIFYGEEAPKSYAALSGCNEYMVIIGNIYEHPELLAAKQN